MSRRLLVDGLNVIGTRPDGWWRDRPAAMRRLVGELERLAGATGDRVAVVFDGRPVAVEHDRVEVAFAPRRGRGAGDDVIVDRVGADPEAAGLTVVTSDGELVARVRALGASVLGSGALRRELDALASGA